MTTRRTTSAPNSCLESSIAHNSMDLTVEASFSSDRPTSRIRSHEGTNTRKEKR